MKIKNEAELLDKFCDKTHIKEILTEPFFNTNYNEVWSSDGVVLAHSISKCEYSR